VRVLFISGEFPPMQGGVGDYTREIGLALRDLGCEVHVATSTQATPLPGLAIHPTVDRWGWGCWRTLLQLVRHCRPDVVHIQYQAAAYAMRPAINLLPWRLRWLGEDRPRTAVTFHDLRVPYLFPKAGPLRQWLVHELARRSDAAVTTNHEDSQKLQQALPSPGPLHAMIPIGSNIAAELPPNYDRGAWRTRLGAGPDDLLLCFFGFINARKGVDALLHALHLITTDSHSAVNPMLLFIGGKTGASDPTNITYLAHIKALITELGLDDRVRWTGYVPSKEVSASFLASDLCVLPFRDGVSFLHGTFHAALAHGVPILTTQPRVPLPELIHEGNVFLVPPEKPQALMEAITHLAAAPDLRRTLGAGAKTLSEQFGWEKIAADTLDVYRAIGASRDP
jgi:glycosyltransferase involved in cell wall biosynthesis